MPRRRKVPQGDGQRALKWLSLPAVIDFPSADLHTGDHLRESVPWDVPPLERDDTREMLE